jgi:hypothetical protein
MKTVTCKSGTKGWQSKLQKIYTTYDEFLSYCETYQIHLRLGFKSEENCWKQNPMVRGSVIPNDLEVVR